MNDNEQKAFGTAFRFYERWRSVVIETDEQWETFNTEVGQLAIDMCRVYCPVAQYLFEAVVCGICDLYKDGMKPVPANYFGRDDL